MKTSKKKAQALGIIAGLAVSFASIADTAVVNGITWSYTAVNGTAQSVRPVNKMEMTGSIAIPSSMNGLPVTSIAAWAFDDCKRMAGVEIPSSVTSIGKEAFDDCPLATFSIPANVVEVGSDVIDDDSPWWRSQPAGFVVSGGWMLGYKGRPPAHLVVPGNVKGIASEAFDDCEYVTTITIPSSVKYVSTLAFDDCDRLQTLIIPSSLNSQVRSWRLSPRVQIVVSDSPSAGNTHSAVPSPNAGAVSAAPTSHITVISDVAGGKVKGTGTYRTGRIATLRATPARGYVFAGWYKDGEPLKGTSDYRSKSFSYVTEGRDVTIVAKFVTEEEDMQSLNFSVSDLSSNADGSAWHSLRDNFKSHSMPNVRLKGLPSGLKFNTKTFVITGKTMKPGIHKVKALIKNASVKRAIVEEFDFVVPNRQSGLYTGVYADYLNYSADAVQYQVKAGTSVEMSPMSGIVPQDWRISITGLPVGLRYNASTGLITGTAKRAGIRTATINTIVNKQKHQDTVTFTVMP